MIKKDKNLRLVNSLRLSSGESDLNAFDIYLIQLNKYVMWIGTVTRTVVSFEHALFLSLSYFMFENV